jgi:signal transduction histidine kinase/CheY-like chemotaxis protein
MTASTLTAVRESALSGHKHAVQFYESEAFLRDTVAGFIGNGLVAGEPVIVIASEEHRNAFVDALEERGLDTVEAEASGDLVMLDAREALSSFMAGSTPDAERFQAIIGGLIGRTARGRQQCRAYGEMVDVLWRDGNPAGAISLEELWNDLAKHYTFNLLCAYPMSNFYSESHAAEFEHICRTHSHVFPAESISPTHSDPRALAREIAVLQQQARALTSEIEHRQELENALREALVTQRKAEQEKDRLAQEASRMKDQFLATLSHELRTPLTAILGWSRMLTIGGLDADTMRAACGTIERAAKTQAALIDDLLDLSKVVTGKMSLRYEPVELTAVIESAIETVRLAAETKSIRLDVAPMTDRAVVTGDMTRLQQIIWNLLSNAIKFSDTGGSVLVALDRHNDLARVIVRDEGRGISAAFLPHVFDPFRQADGAITREHGGLGLGLAIVKYLAELHGGSVTATSAGEGHGATFVVTLPLAMQRMAKSEPAPADDVTDINGVAVLVIDEDGDTRELVAAMLRRAGGTVVAAESVANALSALGVITPDVIVSDLTSADGAALLRTLAADQRRCRIPVIELTDHAERVAGFSASVRKPIDPLLFVRAVAEVSLRA